jgi:hypothetical protein
MVSTRCAGHEHMVRFLRTVEAGIPPERLRGNGPGPAQSVQTIGTGIDCLVRRAFLPAGEIFTRRTTGLGQTDNHQTKHPPVLPRQNMGQRSQLYRSTPRAVRQHRQNPVEH